MESAIKEKVDLIAECIFTKIQELEDESFGLYNGAFGQLLFLLHYSKYTKNEKHTLLTERYAEKLLQQFIEKDQHKLHTFCSGFSGILYLFEYLRDNHFIDLDVSEVQPYLDNFIVAQMRQDIQHRDYDFLHGALGVGVYFLKTKSNPQYILELIDFLYHTAEVDADRQIFKWETVVDQEKNNNIFNFSLSHGMSSIIVFLSRVIQSGLTDERVPEILTGAVNYMLSQQKDVSQFGSSFPSHIPKNSSNIISKSRLAWCYGDLGIGSALWKAGKATNKTEWKEKGLEILLQSTHRRTHQETLVIDAGICHGSAGITMIYRRMFLETQIDNFKDTTQYWINRTLDFSSFEDGLVGYKSFVNGEWKCDFILLTGISGIGLVLLSYLLNDQQEWDELFLLS